MHLVVIPDPPFRLIQPLASGLQHLVNPLFALTGIKQVLSQSIVDPDFKIV